MSKYTQDNQDVTEKEKKHQESLRKNMAMFVQGRWFPLIITLIVLAVFVLIMALFGWRITYAPGLENSWDAISAVATWVGVIISAVGVIASFVAIWYAIQVPKKIADRQDKITLFEKRYECFRFFGECFILCKKSMDKDHPEEIITQCCHMLEVRRLEDLNENELRSKIRHFEYVLHQMEFLFSGIQQDDIALLYGTLYSYLFAILDKKDIEINKLRYILAMRNFIKYTDKIWESVTISNLI